MANTEAPSGPRNALGAWQARALHTITCPSGQRIRIRIPGLKTILERGDLPDRLSAIVALELVEQGGAIGAIVAETQNIDGDDGRSALLERMRDLGAFQTYLVAVAVQEVEVDGDWMPVNLLADGVDSLPDDDVQMIADIVLRYRDRDAVGVKIGVESLDRFATFRDVHPRCRDAEGSSGCPHCQELVERFSSLVLVGL